MQKLSENTCMKFTTWTLHLCLIQEGSTNGFSTQCERLLFNYVLVNAKFSPMDFSPLF